MSVLADLTSLRPGSRVVVSYSGEPDRFSEIITGWPVGDGMCWVSIGADYLGSSWMPPGDGDVRALFECAHKEALMEHHRRNPGVSRDPSSFTFWTGEHLDLHQLLVSVWMDSRGE